MLLFSLLFVFYLFFKPKNILCLAHLHKSLVCGVKIQIFEYFHFFFFLSIFVCVVLSIFKSILHNFTSESAQKMFEPLDFQLLQSSNVLSFKAQQRNRKQS